MARSPPLSVDEQGDLVTTSAVMDALDNGAMRLGTTGQMSVSNNLNVLLSNPSGSGVEVTVLALVTFTDASTQTYPTVHFNPTTDLPTTARTVADTNLSTDATAATDLLADDMSNVMSGGETTFSFGIESGRNEHQVFIKIPPGESIGVSNPFSGLTSATATFTVWFTEAPA